MSYLDNIDKFMDYINKNGGRSHDRINELMNSKELHKLIEDNSINIDFKYIFFEFINILDNPSLNRYPFTRKIELYKNDLFYCFNRYSYEFSAYFNDLSSYRNFPLFVQSAARKYGIEKYANMNINDLDMLLDNYVDMNKRYNPNNNVNEAMVIIKSFDNMNKYDNYEKKKRMNKLNLKDIDDFYIFAEENTCIIENNQLHNNSLWVSKYYGDGYGFDVISYDSINYRERLIEVKSGTSNNFTITKNEYNIMRKASTFETCDYLVYKFTRGLIHDDINHTVYRYDKDNDILVDINDCSNICRLNYIEYDDVEKGHVQEYYVVNERSDSIKRILSNN